MAMDYIAEQLLDTTITNVDAFLPDALLSFIIEINPTDSIRESDRARLRAFGDTLGNFRKNMTLEQRLNSCSMSAQSRNFIREVLQIIESDSTLDETISDLSYLESRILATASSGDDCNAPLCLVAAAKHSSFYWYHINRCLPNDNITYNNSGAMYDPPEDPEMKKDRSGKKKISIVIEADLLGLVDGAVEGFVGGGLAGFLGGAVVCACNSRLVPTSVYGLFGYGKLWCLWHLWVRSRVDRGSIQAMG